MRKKIYDCFAFFNELDLLEIRLNELDKYVDYFVICECEKTFSGEPKSLNYFINKERFAQFEKKIIYIVYPQPQGGGAWYNDIGQKNYMGPAYLNQVCNDDDLIIFSDLDEIPDLRGINLQEINTLHSFEQQGYRCFLNLRHTLKLYVAKIFPYRELKGKELGDMRAIKGTVLPDAGWHFSFLGGAEKIAYKIRSYAHQDFNVGEFVDEKEIQKKLDSNKDVLNQELSYGEMEVVLIDDTFPEYVVKNLDKLKHLLK